ncbi:hypothetical protein Q4489_18105 [Thalassotalea sp. 1_MG-2023]|nr:hypothetical protein [Thalassotalea sp. 1_MG-2023]MDO6428916.1 hypothetical protein [Thalassotalea sp. 1_MG-2023]
MSHTTIGAIALTTELSSWVFAHSFKDIYPDLIFLSQMQKTRSFRYGFL